MEIHIGVDVGGTFTDLAVNIADQGRLILHKLPSTPDRPDAAIVDGILAALSEHDLSAGAVVRLSHGTTVGTNALIQRRIGTVALVTSAGFRDLLEIGRQARPKVYDIHLDNPAPLVPRRLRFEVGERMRADGIVHRPLDTAAVRAIGERLSAAGVDCVVVAFLHSFAYPDHERQAAAILREVLPASVHVITSASVYPEFREYERFSTAVLNGALLTVMNAYFDRFGREVRAAGVSAAPTVSQSAGGLMSIDMARELPIRASLSGPAAGVMGAAYRAEAAGLGDLITLDVGGTSADVSLLQGGRPAEVHDRMLAGFPLRMPALDVNAVGAGGGSIAWIDRDGLLKVGPHSAGAVPGPACYDQGGTAATVTDANVLLGRLNGTALLDGRMPIRRELAAAAVQRLAEALGLGMEETALGIVRMAGATIVKAIRTISVERGHDPAGFALFAFGGAGPLHATDVARELGIKTVIVPPHPGILCAEGLLNSDLVADFVRTVLSPLGPQSLAAIVEARNDLAGRAAAWFARERLAPAASVRHWQAELRYYGQNYELAVPVADATIDAAACAAIAAQFHRAHEQAYGFASPAEPIEFVNLRVKTVGLLPKPSLSAAAKGAPARPVGSRPVLFSLTGPQPTPVYRRAALVQDQMIEGPAILEQMDTTVIVFPGDRCRSDAFGNLVIELG